MNFLKSIKDWQPNENFKFQTKEVNFFEDFLSNKSKKIYQKKIYSTVHEYTNFYLPLFKYQIDEKEFPILYKILNRISKWYSKWNIFVLQSSPILDMKFQDKDFTKRLINRQNKNLIKFWNRAIFVQFIVLEAKCDNEKELGLCLQRLGKLFNFLVDKKLCFRGVLSSLQILQLENDKVAFLLYPTIELDLIPKQLNDYIGLNVFSQEGAIINDFDWTILDKL